MILRNSFTERPAGTPKRMTGLRDFLCNQAGGLAVYAALTLPVVAGLVGFGLDTSVWYAMRRNVQGMADAAGLGFVQVQGHRQSVLERFANRAHGLGDVLHVTR